MFFLFIFFTVVLFRFFALLFNNNLGWFLVVKITLSNHVRLMLILKQSEYYNKNLCYLKFNNYTVNLKMNEQQLAEVY